MNLNIVTPRDAAAATTPVKADDAFDRLLKFVPAPMVGAYLALLNLFSPIQSEALRWSALGVVFVVLSALTVVYFMKRGVKRWTQTIVSVVAFGIWAAAMTFQNIFTGALVIVASLVVIAIRLQPLSTSEEPPAPPPTPPAPAPAPEQPPAPAEGGTVG